MSGRGRQPREDQRVASRLAGAGESYWSTPAEELFRLLDATPQGLTARQAARRLRIAGPNTLRDDRSAGPVRALVRQFENPLVQILLFAAGLSLFLKDWGEASIILAIVLGSTLLGFGHEYRAGAAVARLKGRLALKCRIRRAGKVLTIAADRVVPGDIVLLAAGNLVPADGVVLEASDFLVSEAVLTGEAFPVEKGPGVVASAAALAMRTNCVFRGTSVRSGTCTALVVDTGARTLIGGIAARLEARAPETEFERGVREFGAMLMRATVLMVLFVLTANLLLDRPPVESLLFAVALAVGMSPELLPAIVTVTLSAGARTMAARGVLVRRLEAIENLGSIDVLCTDKTGTLTLGAVSLAAALDARGAPSDEVLRLAYLNAAFETGIENPLDDALKKAGAARGLNTQGWRKVDEIPYDFIRKRLAIVVEDAAASGERRIIVKGACATVLAACTSVAAEAGAVPLTDALREELDSLFRARGEAGFRVLGVATGELPMKADYCRADESGLVFAGFLLFADPPRADASAMVRDLAALGIRLKIVTGDNRHVAAHVAQAVGIDAGGLLTGAELAALSDDALALKIADAGIFVEVDPEQKERIVRALKRNGHAVGYLGDGINDAPALRAADIGISVDGAVDVARESADVVLLRPDLDALRRGVEDGRRAFANTLKYISITTSANFGNMVSMALAALFLPFLPLAAKQILLNNFLSDLPVVTIATDRVDAEGLRRPERWRTADIRSFMLVFGLISTVFDLAAFWLLVNVFDAGVATFQTTWFVVSLLTELAVVMVLRTRLPLTRSRPGALLAAASVAVAAVAVAIPYWHWIAAPFGFVPLDARVLGAALLIVAAYVAVNEAAKRAWVRSRENSRPRA